MAKFRLSRQALKDVSQILSYLHREVSAEVADTMEDRLFEAFEGLAAGHLLGHRRTDIPVKDLLAHIVKPYVVIFKRSRKSVFIAKVVHGSRNIQSMF